MRVMARNGVFWSILVVSIPTRSLETFERNAILMSSSVIATHTSGSILRPKRDANRMHRRTRSGSSRNVCRGGRGVRAILSLRSERPCRVQSSTSREWTLKNSELTVRSRLSASSKGVPSFCDQLRQTTNLQPHQVSASRCTSRSSGQQSHTPAP